MDRNSRASPSNLQAPDASDGPPARRRLGITGRLRWSFLLSSTLPLLLVGTLLIVVLLQVQQRNAYASQQAVADRIAGNITTFLYDLEQQLLRAGPDLRPAGTRAALDAAVRRVVNSSPDLRALTILDAKGAPFVVATSDLLAARGTAPAPIDPRLIEGAVGVGQGGRTTFITGGDGQPVFQVVLPIRESQGGMIAGALAAEVSSSRIGQILRLAVQGQGKTAYLVDPQRAVLLAAKAPGWQPPADFGLLFREGATVGEYRGGDGQPVVGARAVVAPITAASWSVVVEEPSRALFVEVYRSMLLLGAVVALAGLIAFGWALFQARRLVVPIRALTAGAQELAGGRLEHRIEVEPGDELGQLATTFNNMAERLQGSLGEIERQNERLRRGLALARDIQQGLLPSAPPWRSGVLSVYGRSLPASEVGGDFYSYMALPDGRAAIAIGDISGKGVAAALLMALTSSTLESQSYFIAHPAEMLHSLHEALRPRLQANQMNAALMVAVFAPDAGAVTLANAGMVAPLLIRAADEGAPTASFLEVSGLPIGTGIDGQYAELTVELGPDDTLLFISDGIVEAHNEAGELFGFERLEAAVAGLPCELGVDAIAQAILAEVLAFVGGAEPHDDITIVATRPLAGSPHGRTAAPAETVAATLP